MRRVLDYIDAQLRDDLGLVELATIAGLSPRHFVEAFKISVGKPPPICPGTAGPARHQAPARQRPDDRRDRTCRGVLESEPSDSELSAGDRAHSGPLPALAQLI
jgi:AraC-like DNA-binding protein